MASERDEYRWNSALIIVSIAFRGPRSDSIADLSSRYSAAHTHSDDSCDKKTVATIRTVSRLFFSSRFLSHRRSRQLTFFFRLHIEYFEKLKKLLRKKNVRVISRKNKKGTVPSSASLACKLRQEKKCEKSDEKLPLFIFVVRDE